MRRWQVLLVAGLIGVASLLLVPFEMLISKPMPAVAIRFLGLINPTILTMFAVLIGEVTSRTVRLRAPLIDAWIASEDSRAVLSRQLRPALIVAVAVAAILVAYNLSVGRALLAAAAAQRSPLATFDLPLVSRLLYGGITEELLTRWGLVSLFAWIGWWLVGRPERLPNSVAITAVTAAALLFGAGHLPVLFLITPQTTPTIVITVLVANAVPGILFGALYIRNGLEAAIIAHAAAHLLAAIVSATAEF